MTVCLLGGFFFFSDTAPTEIYTLSLHDALPISRSLCAGLHRRHVQLGASRRLDLRSEEHTSELQSHSDLVCRLLLEKKQTRSTATSNFRLTGLRSISIRRRPKKVFFFFNATATTEIYTLSLPDALPI